MLAGCEISTGPGTNASEIMVGPVTKLVYFQLNLLSNLCSVSRSISRSTTVTLIKRFYAILMIVLGLL